MPKHLVSDPPGSVQQYDSQTYVPAADDAVTAGAGAAVAGDDAAGAGQTAYPRFA